MQSASPEHAVRRGIVVTFSALTLSVFAAIPSAMAASNSHANDHSTKANGHSTSSSASSHSSNSSNSTASSHQTSGTSGTSGDPTQPQPVSNADQNSGGANGQCPGGAYCSTRDGSPSGNGNGGGQATGKPCAGCVGKADNKNPPGQAPDGSDANAGYECDTNHGIGRTNPAHTGCATPTQNCTTNPTAPECSGGGDCTTNPTAPECNGGGDCTTNPTAPECNGGGDCTSNPSAPDCNGGGPDCTTNPTAPECINNQPDCTTNPTAPECVGGETGCVATAANNFCTDVLGEKQTRTPTTPTTPTTVEGEQVTSTPPASGALPFTGTEIGAMVALGLMTLLAGTLMLAMAARRRTDTTS